MEEADLNKLNEIKCRGDKNFDDTMRFYQEGLEINAVEKLLRPNANSAIKKNRYNEFIQRYTLNKSNISKVNSDFDEIINNEFDNSNDGEKNCDSNLCEDEVILTKQNEIDNFFDEVNSNTHDFNLDFSNKNKSHKQIRKVLYNFLSVIFLGTIIFLSYKIKSLNKEIELMQMTVSEYKIAKHKLELMTTENKNMKKIIEDLGNKETNNSNSSNSDKISVEEKNLKKEYIVQKGDTLFGISKQFYKDGNLYTKIIDANKLVTENLSEGQKLLIE